MTVSDLKIVCLYFSIPEIELRLFATLVNRLINDFVEREKQNKKLTKATRTKAKQEKKRWNNNQKQRTSETESKVMDKENSVVINRAACNTHKKLC